MIIRNLIGIHKDFDELTLIHTNHLELLKLKQICPCKSMVVEEGPLMIIKNPYGLKQIINNYLKIVEIITNHLTLHEI